MYLSVCRNKQMNAFYISNYMIHIYIDLFLCENILFLNQTSMHLIARDMPHGWNIQVVAVVWYMIIVHKLS